MLATGLLGQMMIPSALSSASITIAGLRAVRAATGYIENVRPAFVFYKNS